MPHKTQTGFTLMEMIATIVIAAIMITMAVPGLATFMNNNRMVTQINDFVASANIARMEAVKRAAHVVVCKSSNLTSCATSGGGWEQGWIAFVDSDSSGTHDAGEDIITSHGPLSSGITLTGSASNSTYVTADVSSTFYFKSDGSSNLTAYGEIVLCDTNRHTSVPKAVVINPVGRVETMNSTELTPAPSC